MLSSNQAKLREKLRLLAMPISVVFACYLLAMGTKNHYLCADMSWLLFKYT